MLINRTADFRDMDVISIYQIMQGDKSLRAHSRAEKLARRLTEGIDGVVKEGLRWSDGGPIPKEIRAYTETMDGCSPEFRPNVRIEIKYSEPVDAAEAYNHAIDLNYQLKRELRGRLFHRDRLVLPFGDICVEAIGLGPYSGVWRLIDSGRVPPFNEKEDIHVYATVNRYCDNEEKVKREARTFADEVDVRFSGKVCYWVRRTPVVTEVPKLIMQKRFSDFKASAIDEFFSNCQGMSEPILLANKRDDKRIDVVGLFEGAVALVYYPVLVGDDLMLAEYRKELS